MVADPSSLILYFARHDWADSERRCWLLFIKEALSAYAVAW